MLELEAFLLNFINGITFEFGDDLVCWASEAWLGGDLDRCRQAMVAWLGHRANAAPYWAFAGTLLGYAVSPLSILLAAFIGKPKTPGEAFWRGAGLELLEGLIAVIGQVITDHNFSTAIWSLGLSAVIAPVRGSVAGITLAWQTSAVFKFCVLLAVLGAVAFGLNVLGILQL